MRGTVSIAGDSQRAARDYHQRTGLPVLAWSPLGQGYFATPPAPGSQRVYGCPRNAERRRRAEELAQERQLSVAQIALAYLLNQPFAVYPVVAASTVDKMRSNLAATGPGGAVSYGAAHRAGL
jgi:aryl-alcohol dehydrogenase-like predicted oxidoreductase